MLGGDDPDETVLVQRTAAGHLELSRLLAIAKTAQILSLRHMLQAARVLAGKALKGAVSEGGTCLSLSSKHDLQ